MSSREARARRLADASKAREIQMKAAAEVSYLIRSIHCKRPTGGCKNDSDWNRICDFRALLLAFVSSSDIGLQSILGYWMSVRRT